MNIILHDLDAHLEFAPLTLTRPVGNLRMGIFTNDERWKTYIPAAQLSFATSDYLQAKYPSKVLVDNYWVNASVIPTKEVVEQVKNLALNQVLIINEIVVAFRGEAFDLSGKEEIKLTLDQFIHLKKRWELYQKNDQVLRHDVELITAGRKSKQLSHSCQVIGDENLVFLEDTAQAEGVFFNTTTGPIYLGHHTEVMEGSVIRGGLALCDHSVLKLATKLYGATTIGPYCKVGGEVSNVIFQGYSNKGHDGFLGNSVIGEWCNLGADTNTSNLKNNYGFVKTYDYRSKELSPTSIQFMGLMMGDHSKTGINTMLNTATVIGVSSTVFGGGFPPKFIPNYAWGGFDDTVFDLSKALEAANNMMERRGKTLDEAEVNIMKHLFEYKI